MLQDFSVIDVVNSVKMEIEREAIPIGRQYLAESYYERRMEEYRKQDKLVIFGAGNYGRLLYRMLCLEGLHSVQCFCDNTPANQQRKLVGLDILSPEEAVRQHPDAMYIITPKGYENEIVRQLVHNGVDIGQISIFMMALSGLEG